MPRAIWKGSISFGLVNVPVGLYSATESKVVHFHQIDEKTGKRVHNKRVADGSNKEVEYDQLVKGYEVSKGKYVTITPEELEEIAPGASRTIDIEDFIDLADVDPVYFDKTYYLEPDGRGADTGASKAYVLLREAMNKSEKVAIARFVMRGKQYLGCIRPSGNALVMETMYFPDEVRDPNDLNIPKNPKLDDREVKAARQLVESLSSPWEPERYHDTYRERVLELIAAKKKGKTLDIEPAEERPRVDDLMAALEASISSIKDRQKTKKPAAKKKTTAKKKASSTTRKKKAA